LFFVYLLAVSIDIKDNIRKQYIHKT